jgi:hypothetical protein
MRRLSIRQCWWVFLGLLTISGGFLAVLSRYGTTFPFPGEPTCKGVVAKMTDSDPKMSLPSTFASEHGCSLNTHRSSTSLRLKKLRWSKPRGRIREIFNHWHETRYESSNLSFTVTLLACLDVQPIPTEGQRYKIRCWRDGKRNRCQGRKERVFWNSSDALRRHGFYAVPTDILLKQLSTMTKF